MSNPRFERKQWVGSQLSFFDHITSPSEAREDLYCLTLAQTEALIGVIDHYRFLTRWIDDDPDNPLSLTQVQQFVDDAQRRLMMPCGSDNVIVLSQWTPEGHYQESTDGGVTYHDAPGRDPRNNVPLPPPFLPPDTVDESCTYADSIVNSLINNWINATGATEDEATVIEGIISFLAGIFGAFGVVAAAITLGIAIVIVAFTVAAWKAAFVSAVWDRLRCNLKNNMGADGSFTQDQVDAIYAQIGTDETGIVRISLQGMIAAMGDHGLTIAARAGRGSPTAECCPEDMCDLENWRIYDPDPSGFFGIIDEADDENGRLRVSTLNINTNSVYYVSIQTTDDDLCCVLNSYEIVTSGAAIDIAWVDCGGNRNGSFSTGIIGDARCVNSLQWQSSAPFTVDVFLSPCPP